MTFLTSRTLIGHVAEVRRYPVKSMQGEILERTRVGPDGCDGDRRFAVIDAESGRVASAKNPRKWGGLFRLRAELREGKLVVTSEDGSELRDDFDAELSRMLGRTVALRGTPSTSATIEIHWPDVPGLANAGSETEHELSTRSYMDVAPLHLLTRATLRRLRELAPASDFAARRFRPNLVIETLPERTGFVEAAWPGRRLVIGDVRLQVTAPCSRCVMTTLGQPGLPDDSDVLRAAVNHNAAEVGVYANSFDEGEIATGAPVWLE